MAELQERTREQEFAEVIGAAREQGLFGGKDEAEAPPKQEAEAPAREQKPGAARDESGKFVKQEAKAEAAPFDGFEKLDPKVQEQFNQVFGRTKQLENEIARVRRENGALMGRVPQLQSELARLQRSGEKPASTEKAADLTAQLKRFQDYKERYPDDAAAIEEYIAATRQELADTKTQLADKVSQLESRFESSEKQRKAQADAEQNHRVIDQLDAEHPEWRVVAGWKDAEGNDVPATQAQFHPHFQAWQNALPAELRDDYAKKLGTRSATLIGHVLDHFKRDYETALAASGQQADDADPIRTRRAEALRDISPTGSAGNAPPVDRSLQTPANAREEEFAATVAKFRHLFPQWGTP